MKFFLLSLDLNLFTQVKLISNKVGKQIKGMINYKQNKIF